MRVSDEELIEYMFVAIRCVGVVFDDLAMGKRMLSVMSRYYDNVSEGTKETKVTFRKCCKNVIMTFL